MYFVCTYLHTVEVLDNSLRGPLARAVDQSHWSQLHHPGANAATPALRWVLVRASGGASRRLSVNMGACCRALGSVVVFRRV